MLPLSEELRQAIAEIQTWARLHKTEDDSNLSLWRAIGTLRKAQKVIDVWEGQQSCGRGEGRSHE